MSDKLRPTPETDANVAYAHFPDDYPRTDAVEAVDADFARSLERQRDDALDEIARLKAPVKEGEVDELVVALRIAYSYDVTQDTSTVREVELVHKAASILERISAQLAERDADFAKLKGFAEEMASRLIFEYTEGPCVDQSIGAALPQEVYAYRAAYPKE